MDKTLAVDAARAQRLRSKGYQIVTQNIPGDITPKNRLLMGNYDEMSTNRDLNSFLT
jgi:hypothetical protein